MCPCQTFHALFVDGYLGTLTLKLMGGFSSYLGDYFNDDFGLINSYSSGRQTLGSESYFGILSNSVITNSLEPVKMFGITMKNYNSEHMSSNLGLPYSVRSRREFVLT